MPKGLSRSPIEIERILNQLEQSNLSLSEFARRHSLKVSTLHGWHSRKKAKLCKSAASRSPALIPVKIAQANGPLQSAVTPGLIRLCLRSGHTLEFPMGTSSRFLADFVGALA